MFGMNEPIPKLYKCTARYFCACCYYVAAAVNHRPTARKAQKHRNRGNFCRLYLGEIRGNIIAHTVGRAALLPPKKQHFAENIPAVIYGNIPYTP